ncbi:class I SAM-dependent methyltransferase [Candidatus Woesearchaeota archaeon]|nr:class I SAM-dependent methyltransferase [Candidatus Woesearchaeota archaeon]
MQLTIPSRKNVKETNEGDPLKYYYVPIIRYPFLLRLKNAVDLLDTKKYDKLLDLGCGSGIFLPELSKHTNNLYATDMHNNMKDVKRMAKNEGVKVKLFHSNILKGSFIKEKFDAIVCVSVLEHLDRLDIALDNINKILKDDGVAVFGFPSNNFIVDTALKLLCWNIEEHHVSSHQNILKAIQNKMNIVQFNNIPNIKNPKRAIYIVCKCVKK